MDSFLLKAAIKDGLLDQAGADRLRAAPSASDAGDSVAAAIQKAAGLDDAGWLAFLSRRLGLPLADLESSPPPRELVARYPARVLLKHRLLPVAEHNGSVTVATHQPMDAAGADELRLASGKDVALALASAEDIDRLLKQLVAVGADTLESMQGPRTAGGVEVIEEIAGDVDDLEEAAEDASIVKFVNQVLAEAAVRRATDVHFEPFEDQLRVRYRVDGVLVEANIPASVARFRLAIVSRLKILSHLDIAEKRLPQDGRMKLKVSGKELDVRVSVIPMLYGEAVVLRLLDRGAAAPELAKLGMGPREDAIFQQALALPHGIVLVTGPTGSGKTTTLYAGLSRINSVDTKIITIEDPIEYQLRGVNQIQVSEKTGLTFARGLRSVLRHDPDVVLIGEIRDVETAAIAVQASLTGHLVFSTLHTNDAPSAVTRLVDMGVEPYLVASSLELVIAQRLVRLICGSCRQPVAADEMQRMRETFNMDLPAVLHHGAGCRQCANTGYSGRQGVFEMMPISESIQSLVLQQASSGQVRRQARDEGMKTLREDGWRLLEAGATTLDEVMRVTKDERLSAQRLEAI